MCNTFVYLLHQKRPITLWCERNVLNVRAAQRQRENTSGRMCVHSMGSVIVVSILFSLLRLADNKSVQITKWLDEMKKCEAPPVEMFISNDIRCRTHSNALQNGNAVEL